MKTKEQTRRHENDRRRRMLLAGFCIRCMGNRTAEPGHTNDRCAKCAEINRNETRERMRKLRGVSPHVPFVPKKRGARAPKATSPQRSDVYAPETYKPLRGGRRKGQTSTRQTTQPVESRPAPKPKKRYGTLSREDIRVATSALPLRPPGK